MIYAPETLRRALRDAVPPPQAEMRAGLGLFLATKALKSAEVAIVHLNALPPLALRHYGCTRS